MRERDFYHRKAIRSNSPSMWKKIKKLKSSVNKQLRESKTKYFRNLIQKNSGHSAQLWKTLNEVTSRKHFSPLSCIESEGVVISDDCWNFKQPLLHCQLKVSGQIHFRHQIFSSWLLKFYSIVPWILAISPRHHCLKCIWHEFFFFCFW